MKEIINDIFELNNFNSKKINENKLYINSDNNIKNYWLVLECSPKDILEKQADIIELCISEIRDPAVEKNITLLCLWEVDDIDDNINKLINNIEEDPYYFKKNVLYFTKKELNEIKIEIKKRPLSSLINEDVTSAETFEFYKKNYNKSTWQSLLYRIIIKASFINIKKKSSINILDLENDIINKISSKTQNGKLFELEKIILNIDFKQDLDPLNLLKNIEISLTEAGYEL